jgi:hypothetical protein
MKKSGVQLPGPVSLQANGELHPGSPQPRGAASRLRIWIRHGKYHTLYSRIHYGLRAWTGFAIVIARFEGYVHGGAPSLIPGGVQRCDLGVFPAELGVKALAYNLSALHQYGANHRVGSGSAPAALSQLQRPPHEARPTAHTCCRR